MTNGYFPEWAQNPERNYKTDAQDVLDWAGCLADQLYDISRKDEEDLPRSAVNDLAKQLKVIDAAIREAKDSV